MGASLLAIAVDQPTSILTDPASSRASSLPQRDALWHLRFIEQTKKTPRTSRGVFVCGVAAGLTCPASASSPG
ncbi:hypothetical protein FHK92_22275 [Pseudomonas brassicacearum subsp. neoaurantiaca]|uniref:Uncharacterized protein n=1 Tax=Pseudomonas brassicacearum subsp. neoaurantiaca TaxID=494916 RepID=A0A7V8UF81_9PSED|nr:hypothetical protein [Pseudomonas brassicacearum subsp. neoaurantiaca]